MVASMESSKMNLKMNLIKLRQKLAQMIPFNVLVHASIVSIQQLAPVILLWKYSLGQEN